MALRAREYVQTQLPHSAYKPSGLLAALLVHASLWHHPKHQLQYHSIAKTKELQLTGLNSPKHMP